jgi:adenosylmethionine-8-amino-7-oxononanoate aminotransferase
VSCLGHNHPQVIDAIKTQLDDIPLAHTAFFSNPAMEQGLICYPMSGTIDGKNVLLAPPFILSDNQVGEIVGKLALAIEVAVASARGVRA